MRRWGGWWVSMVVVCACSDRGIVADADADDDGGGGSSSAGSATLVSIGDASVDDDAGSQSGSTDGSDTGLDEGPQQADAQWLLAVSTFLAPETPLQWHISVDWQGDEVVAVQLQSLSLDPSSTTTPRELVGAPTVADELGIDDLGNFGLAFDELFVPGEANPITGAAVTVVDLRLVGMGTATTSCGIVTGTITAPIESALDGSTFAAVPITSVDDLPLEFPSACE